jgi:flagellin
MGLTVNTNTQSIFAQRALGKNTMALQRSIEKLSTGYRINKAGDDAAGLSISEKMTSQVKGLEKAKQNSSDGVSLIQTAEGALSVIQDNMQRIRELFVQAVNGTNGTSEKDAIQREINERITTIDAIAQATKFNGNALLYNASDITLQTGADNGQTTTISLADNTATANVGIDINITYDRVADNTEHGALVEGTAITVGFALDELSVGAAVAAKDGATTTLTASGLTIVDTMIGNLSRMRSYLGAVQNSLESRMEYLDVAKENMSAARARVKDVDVASESSVLIKNQILQQSAASMLSQANSTPQIALSLLPR